LAVALAAGGRWEDAETQFTEIVQQRPEDPIARFNLGRMYFNRSSFDQAEELFKAAVKLSPTNQVFLDHLRQAVERKAAKP
jgi:Flp pilus assembly protein TadD